jgi:branched-chain amino acid transport system substrate-binding protein
MTDRAGLGVAVILLVAVFAAGCAGGDDPAEPVATSSCGPVLYEGEGEPDVIVVADNPLRGTPGVAPMVAAMEHVFRKRGFRAGELHVGFQSCDHSVGEGGPDPVACRRNARAAVATESVVGVIGPYNSGCAELQIPIVSRASAGPLAMVSPANTFEGLTRGEYARGLYPDTGVRSYARVIANDRAQAAATAHLAKQLGARRAALILQRGVDDPYVAALASSFRVTARSLGIATESFDWLHRRRYTELAADVARGRPDFVYVVGLTEQNAKVLIEDLRAALGPDVPFAAPDSFAFPEAARELGPVGDGFLVTVPGLPPEALPPAGKRLLRELGPSEAGPFPPGAAEAAQATEVLLDAIARSDGTRASVVDELFATKVENGILGSFSLDRFGDIDPAPVGVYRFEDGGIVTHGLVRAPLGTGG